MPVTNRNTHVVLAGSGTDSSHTGDTNETVLATVDIPSLRSGDMIRVIAQWNYTNSVNTKTPRVRFGGIGGSAYFASTATTSINLQSINHIWNWDNAGTPNQKGHAATLTPFGIATAGQVTGTVDTSAPTTLVLTGQLANSGETITLEAYTVELLRAP